MCQVGGDAYSARSHRQTSHFAVTDVYLISDLCINVCIDAVAAVASSWLNLCLSSIFQVDLGQPVPENVCILDFTGAKDDGGGDW